MKNKNFFYVYTINGRVVWLDHELFWIPVLPEMHKVYEIKNTPEDNGEYAYCLQYVVKNFYEFTQDELAFSALPELESQFYFLCYSKTQVFLKLSKIVNQILQLMRLPVEFNELEQTKVSIQTSLDTQNLDELALSRHSHFITNLRDQKRAAVHDLFVKFTNEIIFCKSEQEIQNLSNKISFNRLNII